MSNDIALQIIRYVSVISFVLLDDQTSRLAHPPKYTYSQQNPLQMKILICSET